MSWKPDFTQTNPWESMPADYPGIATFVPTVENSLPPWEGQVGAEAIPSFGTPAYQDIAQRITYTPSVTELFKALPAAKPAIIAAPEGEESKIFTQEEWGRAGLTSAPREWEAEGYQPWYYDTPDGRQLLLEDIARSRASRGLPIDYERLAEFGVPPEYAEPFKALPAAKPGIAGIDWSKWVVPALVGILVLARRRKR